MRKLLTTLSSFFIITCLFAQKQSNIWMFGSNTGLDFNSGTPVPIMNSNFGGDEGTASIADKTTGKLLFYSDSWRIYDATAHVMPNGYPIGGMPSSTQGVVAVPKPGSDSIYYLFSVDAEAGDYYNPSDGGLNVNIIDMSLNNGLGAVTSRDQLLLAPTAEKCATTLACNGIDTWVVVHQWNTDAFYAYKVTASGISAPVISHTGIVHNNANNDGSNGEAIGYMRISNDGKKLALACEYSLSLVQLFDFDNSTGTVSNPAIDLNFPSLSGPYGVCFSPGNSKLYVTSNANTGDTIYQYNMLAGANSAIIASRQIVGTARVTLGAIQQGPDGKLYVARAANSLGIISQPDSSGLACNYIDSGLYLGGSQHLSTLGLPDVIPNYIRIPPYQPNAIQAATSAICNGQGVLLTATGGISYNWSPAIGLNSATGDSVFATPTTTTTYTVTGTTSGSCSFTDSIVVTVVSPGNLNITANPDSICSGNNSILSISGTASNLQWQSADTTGNFLNINNADSAIYQTPLLSQTTGYRLIVQAGSCIDTSATISVVVRQAPAPPLLSATPSLICASDSSLIQATPGYASYLWNTNDTTASTYANTAGDYWVTVTNSNGCTAVSAHQSIQTYPVPSVSIVERGDTLTSFNAIGYQWFFDDHIIAGATGAVYIAHQPGDYSVQIVDSNGCYTRSNNVIITTTGINGLTQTGIVNIYPNPFNNIIFIDNNNDAIVMKNIAVYNAIGEKVLSNMVTGSPHQSIDVSILPDGIYILQVTTDNSTYLKKMIKQ